MKETIELGSSPYDQACAMVGTEGYSERARTECKAFINQLSRTYVAAHGRPLPEGLKLRIKSNEHDFGTYYEVAASFDENDREAIEAAFWLDENCPALWDNQARKEIEGS